MIVIGMIRDYLITIIVIEYMKWNMKIKHDMKLKCGNEMWK